MVSPLDTAIAIANRKKQLLANPGLPDLTAGGISTANAQPTTNPAANNSMNAAPSTTPLGFQQTPMVTPAAQALGQATMGADNRVFSAPAAATGGAHLPPEDQALLDAERAAAKSAPAAAPAVPAISAGANAGGFDYSGMTRTPEQMQAEARARAAMQIDTRAQAIKDALVRLKATAADQRKGQLTNLAGMEEGNRYRFAGSNLGTSGFMAGANAVAQGATQDSIGQINQGERQAVDAAGNQLSELEKLRGNVETATLADLERINNDVQFKGADLASVLANRNFELQRGKSLLPGELTAQGYANQGLSLGLERGRGLLPYELGNAATNLQRNQGMLPFDLGNAATNLQRNQGMLPLDVLKAKYGIAGDALQLDTATKMQPYTLEGARLGNERAQLANDMAALQNQLALDPASGMAAQQRVDLAYKQKQIEHLDAQIKQTNAKALSGGGSGFTAWQQYQMIRDQKGDGEKAAAAKDKAREKLVESFRSDYYVSQSGADLWADFMELAMEPNPDGTMPNRGELDDLLGKMLKAPSVSNDDIGWARSMFWAGQGDQGAQNTLNTKYSKRKPTAVPGAQPIKPQIP